MNDDTISRRAAIKAICEHGTELERRGITVLAVANHKQVTVDLLENLPSAERRGQWKQVGGDAYRCSACGEISCCNSPFCSECGAKMEGEEE